ncbi:FHA domain-containing protein [Pannus brasiliensis CCIBt3594]|uniref:FHA domain-containing protein n=1 Tax=Pannus brasiliensis CCIBt3594 TaxID=1427578 RepID=A0AAW9QR31_9CHRO
MKTQPEHFLLVEDSEGKNRFVLTAKSYSIGRVIDRDICLHSQFVSRHHATLLRQERGEGEFSYRIVDGDGNGRSSANGLLINGKKCYSHDLVDGDEIVFGPRVSALYQYRQGDTFSPSPENDPFDITLIDPAMMIDEE